MGYFRSRFMILTIFYIYIYIFCTFPSLNLSSGTRNFVVLTSDNNFVSDGFTDKHSAVPNFNLVNEPDLTKILKAEIFVHKDGQLKAAHLILDYNPLSSIFQAPKYVIKAKRLLPTPDQRSCAWFSQPKPCSRGCATSGATSPVHCQGRGNSFPANHQRKRRSG